MTVYRIIIEGNGDDLFMPSLYADVAKLIPLSNSITFEVGKAALVPLVKETQ